MPSRTEVAALMAADGEYEQKIALLKKAVTVVTLHKQELEQEKVQLLDQIRTLQQDLSASQAESAKLKTKVAAFEKKAEEASSANFGQTVLKGLSSLMTATSEDGGGGGGAKTGGGRPRGDATAGGGRRGASKTATPTPGNFSLPPDEVEDLVVENERLHVMLFEQKSSARSELDRKNASNTALKKELKELRVLLDTTTKRCDELNVDCLRESAMGQFCFHFAKGLASRPQGRAASSSAQLCMEDVRAITPNEYEVVRRTTEVLRGRCEYLRALLSAISVLLACLRDAMPLAHKATMGDIRYSRDALIIILDSHMICREAILHALVQVESCLPDPSEEEEAPSLTDPATIVHELAQALQAWIHLLRPSVPLIIDAMICHVPDSFTFLSLTTASEESGTAVKPCQFEAEVSARGVAVLSAMEGTLAMLHRLTAPYSPHHEDLHPNDNNSACHASGSSAQFFLACEAFWLEGSASVYALGEVTAAFCTGIDRIAEVCQQTQTRDAANFVCKSLRSFLTAFASPPSASHGTKELAQRGNAMREEEEDEEEEAWRMISMAGSSSYPPVEAGQLEELLRALAAADRTAMIYHRQWKSAVVELGEREDALRAVQMELFAFRAKLEAEKENAQRSHVALEEQIKVLSDRLVELTQPAHPPPPRSSTHREDSNAAQRSA